MCDQFSDDSWLGPLPPAQRKLHAKQVKRRYTYRSTWLGFLVTGTFSLSSGSGAFSIAPSLKVSAVVDDKSWSGRMFGSGFSPNEESRVNVWRCIEYFIEQSQYAFSAGNAAPTDIVGSYTITIPLIYVGNPSLQGSPTRSTALTTTYKRSHFGLVLSFIVRTSRLSVNSSNTCSAAALPLNMTVAFHCLELYAAHTFGPKRSSCPPGIS